MAAACSGGDVWGRCCGWRLPRRRRRCRRRRGAASVQQPSDTPTPCPPSPSPPVDGTPDTFGDACCGVSPKLDDCVGEDLVCKAGLTGNTCGCAGKPAVRAGVRGVVGAGLCSAQRAAASDLPCGVAAAQAGLSGVAVWRLSARCCCCRRHLLLPATVAAAAAAAAAAASSLCACEHHANCADSLPCLCSPAQVPRCGATSSSSALMTPPNLATSAALAAQTSAQPAQLARAQELVRRANQHAQASRGEGGMTGTPGGESVL